MFSPTSLANFLAYQHYQQFDWSVSLYGLLSFEGIDESMTSVTHHRVYESRKAPPGVALTLAICSNQIANLHKYWRTNFASLRATDSFLIVIDLESSPEVEALRAEMESYGVDVIVNNENRGLSYSRNFTLRTCRTNYVIFTDDDVTIAKETVESIRREFAKGYEIVGARICPPTGDLSVPWFISQGQLHYLALHNPREKVVPTWGACMAVKLSFVKTFKFTFRDELGRKGKRLNSGEDTTFLREMKHHGAKESFLNNVSVTHHVDHNRLSISYMARRAYWQGRSEVRRSNVGKGVIKEWRRYLNNEENGLKESILAVLYIIAVLSGVIWEALVGRTPESTPRVEHHAVIKPLNEF